MSTSTDPRTGNPDSIDLAAVDLTDASIWEGGAPLTWLDALRERSPVHWHEEADGPGFWAITRHEHVRDISKDPANFSSWTGGPLRLDPEPDVLEQIRLTIIGMDPPDHRSFRNAVGRAFTPKMIGRIEPLLERETKRMLDALQGRDRCDFVADVAAPIPLWSISELMGVPVADRMHLYELSHALIDDQDPEVAPTPETAMESTAEIFNYATALAAKERANPGDNLTAALLHAEVDGRALDDIEYLMFFVFLIVAGNETTRTGVSNGLLALLDHPEQLARLKADPSLIPSACDEMLRWAPPIHHFRRTVMTDLEIGGQKVAKGDKVLMWYRGANGDPRVFDNPTEFRIDRTPNAQLSFGLGEHFCLGANLARMQMRVIFTEILSRLDEIELVGPERRLHSNLINGVKEMQIRYTMT